MAQSGSMVLVGGAGQDRDRRRLRCLLINMKVDLKNGMVAWEGFGTGTGSRRSTHRCTGNRKEERIGGGIHYIAF